MVTGFCQHKDAITSTPAPPRYKGTYHSLVVSAQLFPTMAWESSLSTPWAILLAGLLVLLTAQIARSRWRARLPPGPRPLPILGNVLDMPSGHLGRGFMDLSAKYGMWTRY